MTHAHKCTYEQPHAHIYAHTPVCSSSHSHMHALSSYVTVKDLSSSYN